MVSIFEEEIGSHMCLEYAVIWTNAQILIQNATSNIHQQKQWPPVFYNSRIQEKEKSKFIEYERFCFWVNNVIL